MKCGRCGAEAVLGSAQCWSCGASLVETGEVARTPESPPAQPPQEATTPGWAAPPPPQAPPPPVDPTLPPPPRGHAPPPPPPAGWQPPAPGTRQWGGRPRAAATRVVQVKGGKAVGCGCGLSLLAAFLLPAISIFSAIGDAIDFDSSSDIVTVDAGTLELAASAEGDLPDDTVHRWSLGGVAGPVTFSVQALDGMDPEVRISEVGGAQVGENDDFAGHDSQVTVTLQEGRRYHVDVSEFFDDGGRYRLLAERGTGPLVTQEVTVPPEFSQVLAGPLTLGVPATGIVEPNGIAIYTFVGVGRPVRITVRGIDGFDPMVVVNGPGGAELAENDDTEGRDAFVEVDVDEGVEVQVVVLGWGGDGGAYEVTVV